MKGKVVRDAFAKPGDSLVARHIDDYIDDYQENAYARFVFNHFRLPAGQMMAFRPWMSQFRLFCTHRGERFRVTGASRLGDVWLTRDFEREDGYEVRGVCVDDCTDWGREP